MSQQPRYNLRNRISRTVATPPNPNQPPSTPTALLRPRKTRSTTWRAMTVGLVNFLRTPTSTGKSRAEIPDSTPRPQRYRYVEHIIVYTEERQWPLVSVEVPEVTDRSTTKLQRSIKHHGIYYQNMVDILTMVTYLPPVDLVFYNDTHDEKVLIDLLAKDLDFSQKWQKAGNYNLACNSQRESFLVRL
jgi:hypothetical protein